MKTANKQNDFFNNHNAEYLVIKLAEFPIEKERSFKCIGNVESTFDKEYVIRTSGNLLLYFAKDSSSSALKRGDVVIMENTVHEIGKAKNPYEFDYRSHLKKRQIFHQVFVGSNQWKRIKENQNKSLFDSLNFLSDLLLSRLGEFGFSGDEYAVCAALLLGNKDYLSKEISRSFSTAGAMHVLAVSGLHVGILYLIFNSILSWLNRSKLGKIVKAITLLMVIWAYAALTGFSPSICRASTMFSAVIIGSISNRKSSILNTICASAFILLILDPYLILEVGFQLSYAAVLSIVLIQPMIYKTLDFKHLILDKIWSISSVSLAAQIGTFPLAVYYFHQFPTYFLITNLVVIPGAFLIMLIGIVFFVLIGFEDVVGVTMHEINGQLAGLLWTLIKTINTFVKWVDNLAFSSINGISILSFECLVLYLLISVIIHFIKYRKSWSLFFLLIFSNLFCMIQVTENQMLRKAKILAIYHVRNGSVISFISYQKNLCLSDSLHIADKSKFTYHVQNHWYTLDANNAVYVDYHDPDTSNQNIIHNGFYQFAKKKILHFHEKHLPQNYGQKLKVDLIVISDNINLNWDSLFNSYDFKLIVLDNSIPHYKRKKWGKMLAENDIPYWDIFEKGAYINSTQSKVYK